MPKHSLRPDLRFVTEDTDTGGSSTGTGDDAHDRDDDNGSDTSQGGEQRREPVFTQAELEAKVAERINRERRQHARETAELKRKAAEYDKRVEGEQTEAQKAEQAAKKAREDAEAALADAVRYKAAAVHQIGEDDFELLGSVDD